MEGYENTDGVVGTVEETAVADEGKKGFGALALAGAAAAGAGIAFGVSKIVKAVKRRIEKRRAEKQAAEDQKQQATASEFDAAVAEENK